MTNKNSILSVLKKYSLILISVILIVIGSQSILKYLFEVISIVINPFNPLGGSLYCTLGIFLLINNSNFIRQLIFYYTPKSLKEILYEKSFIDLLIEPTPFAKVMAILVFCNIFPRSDIEQLIEKLPNECNRYKKPGVINLLPGPIQTLVFGIKNTNNGDELVTDSIEEEIEEINDNNTATINNDSNLICRSNVTNNELNSSITTASGPTRNNSTDSFDDKVIEIAVNYMNRNVRKLVKNMNEKIFQAFYNLISLDNLSTETLTKISVANLCLLYSVLVDDMTTFLPISLQHKIDILMNANPHLKKLVLKLKNKILYPIAVTTGVITTISLSVRVFDYFHNRISNNSNDDNNDNSNDNDSLTGGHNRTNHFTSLQRSNNFILRLINSLSNRYFLSIRTHLYDLVIYHTRFLQINSQLLIYQVVLISTTLTAIFAYRMRSSIKNYQWLIKIITKKIMSYFQSIHYNE